MTLNVAPSMPQVAPFSMLSLLSASLALAGTVGRDGRLEQPPPSVGRELRELKDNPYVCEEGVETGSKEFPGELRPPAGAGPVGTSSHLAHP